MSTNVGQLLDFCLIILFLVRTEITDFLRDDTECFAYYDTSVPESILQAVSDLSEYVASEGPFDGVIGFSQGAALAAMLLARDDFPLPFSFAVFICGGPPFREESLRDGNVEYVDTSPHSGILKLPTAHLIGAQDQAMPECLKLVNACREQMRTVFDHGAGHQVPVNPKGITEAMAKIIQQVITRAAFTQ